MIPKIIHYCWFGQNPHTDIVKMCIESWKKYCPDYDIIEWNESNFNIRENTYISEAYDAKKWAFVSDYVRLSVLDKYGGIYLDTDMELLRSLDIFLNNKAFSGFETYSAISAGIIGAEPENEWIKALLSAYNHRKFKLDNGSLDLTPLPKFITKITKSISNEVQFNNSLQTLRCGLTIYPINVFYPLDNYTDIITITDASYTIHHYAGSWCSNSTSERKKLVAKYPFLKRYLHSSHPLSNYFKLGIDGIILVRTEGITALYKYCTKYLKIK